MIPKMNHLTREKKGIVRILKMMGQVHPVVISQWILQPRGWVSVLNALNTTFLVRLCYCCDLLFAYIHVQN